MTVESKREPYQPSQKRKITIFFEKLFKIIWYLIIAFIVIESLLIAAKFFSKNPNERLCFDNTSCYEYCASFSGAQCLVPEKLDTDDKSAVYGLLLTGKRNILEILNPDQGYCACEDNSNGKNRIEVFYDYYTENN
ncbi:MAG: hypothetical protein Q8P20_08525 [bacterium]|nr:hypothetical protein [bacterium]